MRMLMKVAVPNEGGNEAVKNGQLAKTIGGFLEEYRPEAAYFGIENGMRTAYFVVDMKDPSQMPAMGERFFLGVNALITASPVMNVQDLKAGLENMKL